MNNYTNEMPDYQFLLMHSFYTRASETKGSYGAGSHLRHQMTRLVPTGPQWHLCVFHMGEEF